MNELASLFLKLGTTAFGGPAAHIAMMEDEVVRRRGWISHERFVDLIGATNLIPGPNSTEMALHIGYLRAGLRGLLVAGICFVVPAVLITLLLAYLYAEYGSLPDVQPFVAGIRPAMIAVILTAVARLAKPIVRKTPALIIGIVVLALNLLSADEVLLLLASGAAGLLWNYRDRIGPQTAMLAAMLPLAAGTAVAPVLPAPTLTGLGIFFLRIGSILYGSGYVLVAYLQGGLVAARHWITQQQLVDAVAAGQFTPGPVLSTATFIGYLILGIPGATVATIGIFLPSFLFVLISNPLIPKLRQSPLAGGFLDGVNAASLALMLAVALRFGATELSGPSAWILFLAAAAVMIFRNVNAAWIVVGAAILGRLFAFAGM